MIANTIVVLLEDWYLKPWKTLSPWKAGISVEQQEKQIHNYSQSIINLVRKQLAISELENSS